MKIDIITKLTITCDSDDCYRDAVCTAKIKITKSFRATKHWCALCRDEAIKISENNYGKETKEEAEKPV